MTSVSVFIDYENTRFGAREVFGDPQRDPYTFGHVRPLRLGVLLKLLGGEVPSPRIRGTLAAGSRPAGRCRTSRRAPGRAASVRWASCGGLVEKGGRR